MKYSIKVNEVKIKNGNKDSKGGSLRGFATVVFGDSFKITNIAILEKIEKGQFFVSMPRYKSNERDENGGMVYKDVCNPITKEFREELYGNILEAFRKLKDQDKVQGTRTEENVEMPQFSVTVTPYEKEGSNIRGIGQIYFEDKFIVNNVNILQGKENVFVAMPSYKTKQVDEQGKTVYQDICYPVTKEFREKLYEEIVKTYDMEKAKQQEQTQDRQKQKNESKDGFTQMPKQDTPFR